ncbi:MAG: autotransporter outer membrane beta-barrel domain-containing protein [Rhodobacteraceae bacterium]|nr:MAG: autotransporter outer membrane beta-barrel domain-containing protein [Paracoccaceae bacterium]
MVRLVHCVRACLLALAACVAFGTPAAAYNIPGSAENHIPELSEVATNMVVRGIKSGVPVMRQEGPNLAFATRGRSFDFSARTGGTTPFAFSFEHRDLQTDHLDGTFNVSSAIFGVPSGNGDAVFFGGLIGESVDVRTSPDDGRIRHRGLGLAFGVDYQLSEQFFLTALAGGMALEYEVERGKGAVKGDFSARRRFADISGRFETLALGGDMSVGAGLFYLWQENDSYRESGGTRIKRFSFEQLSASFNLSNTWGQQGGLQPYADLSVLAELWNDSDGAMPGIDPHHFERQARLGLGVKRTTGASAFNIGIGANYTEDEFAGIDAVVAYTFRF